MCSLTWLRIPFTLGHVVSNEEPRSSDEDNRVKIKDVTFDGLISSLQLFVFLWVVASTLTVSEYLRDFSLVRTDRAVLIAYMVTSVALMVFFISRRDRIVAWTPGSRHLLNGHGDLLNVIGLVAFFVLGGVLDASKIVLSVPGTSVSCRLRVLFHVTRICYLGTQTVFCVKFNQLVFLDRIAIRYGLVFIQAVNLSLWFEALMQESSNYQDSDNLGANDTDYHLWCNPHNTTEMHSVVKNIITPTFLPFTIEFALLASEIIAHLFAHPASNHSEDTSPGRAIHSASQERGRDEVDEVEHGLPEWRPDQPGSFNNYQDQDSVSRETAGKEVVLRRSSSTTYEAFSISDRHQSDSEWVCVEETLEQSLEDTSLLRFQTRASRGQRALNSFRFSIWTALTSLHGLMILILALLCHIPVSSGVSSSVKRIALCYLMFTWSMMIIAIWIGYSIASSFQIDRKKQFSSMNYLLLVTSSGPIYYNVFMSVAILTLMTPEEPQLEFSPWFHIALEVLNIVQVFFQVSFTLFVEKVALNATDRGPRLEVFKAVLLYLSVLNIVLWLTSTFGGYSLGMVQSISVDFYGAAGWHTVNNVIVPLLLFFRFNSWLLLTRTYLRVRSHAHAEIAQSHPSS